ncbi:MAG: extracellular solute-binding protein, partial [Gammaproteobacteria bacterium]|nr:extracellular solute-binding protein [Gammaproteobacteria bacterium]
MSPIPRFRLSALAIAALSLTGTFATANDALTVVSWGGSYAKASVEGYHKAFTAETGIEIKLDDYNGGLAQVRAQVEAGNVYWDVVDVELADGVRGCEEGLFEPLDPATLPPGANGEPAAEDYFPGMITECGANQLFYSTVYAYNAKRLSGAKPTTIEDFFDLERFPGRRGMRRSPVVNLELALLGDGVPIDEVYATLDTQAGIDRAFRKLDTIKEEIVWWEAGAQPPQMLADGEVVMSTAYNGRIFNAQVLEN